MRPDDDPDAWYGEVVRLTLPDRELVEPMRRRAAGEFFCVEYGEPPPPPPLVLLRWAEGRVVEKMLDRGFGSVMTGEP